MTTWLDAGMTWPDDHSARPANGPRPDTVTAGRAADAVDDLRAATDDELVDAFLAGRRDAFDVIVERHRRQIYLLCYRFAGNHEDASDLAQDVFIRAFRGLRTFKRQSSLATWLYRIGVNTSLNKASAKRPVTEPIE